MSDYGTIDLSGAIVTASGVAACRPRSLVVYGRSTQDGTPTPDAPVAVVSVAGQLYQQTMFAAGTTRTTAGITVTYNEDGTCTVNGTATAPAWLWGGSNSADERLYVTLPAGTYTMCGSHSVIAQKMVGSTVSSLVGLTVGSATFTLTEETLVKAVPVIPSGTTVSGETAWVAVYAGSTAYPYAPYGNIGLYVQPTSDPSQQAVLPIPIGTNQLRSLPDGTRDELTVDQWGHAVLTKRVGSVTYNGTESWSLQSGTYPFLARGSSALGAAGGRPLMSNLLAYTGQITASTDGDGLSLIADGTTLRVRATGYATADAWRAKLAETPMTVLYPLATPQAIDLGTVELANLTSPELTAWVTGNPEMGLTALLKTGRSTVMWDGEELGAGWTFVSDRREQLLPTDVATIDVPGRDGALFGGVTRAVRQVTLALHVMGPFGERAPHVRELAARLAVDGPRPLMFSDEAPLWRMAVPNAESDSEVYFDAEGYTDVEFVCPDPWLYGEERSVTVPSGGSVTFTVGGTAPTWPTITASATGSSQGTWILRLDDSSKGVYASIASGVTRPIVADCDARTLAVNDATSMLAPSYDWPELTPGTHTLAMTAGTGAATVTWTERWW